MGRMHSWMKREAGVGRVWRSPLRAPTLLSPEGSWNTPSSSHRKAATRVMILPGEAQWRLAPKVRTGRWSLSTNTGPTARPTIPDHSGRAGAQQEAFIVCTEEAGAYRYLTIDRGSGRHQVPGHHWANLTR